MIRSLVSSIIILLLVSSSAHAQEPERPTPPPRETEIPDRIEREEPDRERLPEFELPEYVITGRATFRLPYVHKPKITEQDIYIAEVSEQMTGIDRSIETSPIDISTKTFGEFRTLPSVQHGQIRAGYGRYNTPAVSGWANYRSGDWDVSARLSYLNTDGHLPFAEGYDLDGRFQLGYRLSGDVPAIIRGARSHLTIGFEGLKYGFHLGEMTGPDRIPVIPRTFRTGYTEIGFQSGADAPFDFDFMLGWRGSTVEDKVDTVFRFNDDELYLHLSTLGYIEAVRFESDIEYIYNNIDIEGRNDLNNPQYFKGTVTALIPITQNYVTLELGGSLYSTRHTRSDNELSIKPIVEVRFMPLQAVAVYGRYAPEVIHHSLYSLQRFHRYINWWSRNMVAPVEPLIMPSDENINVIAGVEYNPHRGLNINAYTQYRTVDAYPAFGSIDVFGAHRLIYTGTSTLISVNADVRYAFTDRDIVTTQASIRYTNNDSFELSVPYIAPVEVSAMYTREYPFGLRASAGFEFLSSRRAAYLTGDSNALDTVVNLNLDVQYQFHDIMGVYMKVDNLLDQSYKRYYMFPARPLYVEGGIQISF